MKALLTLIECVLGSTLVYYTATQDLKLGLAMLTIIVIMYKK